MDIIHQSKNTSSTTSKNNKISIKIPIKLIDLSLLFYCCLSIVKP